MNSTKTQLLLHTVAAEPEEAEAGYLNT